MKDDLKTIFDNYRPVMGDNDKYMQRLETKMKALAAVKRYADEQRRLYRRRLIIALSVGVVLGVGMTVYMLLHPFAVTENPTRLTWLVEHCRPMVTVILLTSVSIGAAVLFTPQRPAESSFSRSTP